MGWKNWKFGFWRATRNIARVLIAASLLTAMAWPQFVSVDRRLAEAAGRIWPAALTQVRRHARSLGFALTGGLAQAKRGLAAILQTMQVQYA